MSMSLTVLTWSEWLDLNQRKHAPKAWGLNQTTLHSENLNGTYISGSCQHNPELPESPLLEPG